MGLSALSFLFNELIASPAYEKSTYIKESVIEKRNDTTGKIKRHVAKLGAEKRVFYITHFDGLLGIMKGICIIQIDDDFNIARRLDAKEGKWDRDKWVLKKGAVRTFDKGIETSYNTFDTYDLFVQDTPEDFIVRKRSPEDTLTINVFRLHKLITVLKESGFKYSEEAVNFHLKFAFPFAIFILALLGVSIPFLFDTQRSVINTALGFVFTVVTSFFYMGFITIGLSMGKVSSIPPFFSAWMANIIFIIAGFYALSKVKR